MWAGFFCRQDVSISIFGRTKEFSEVRGTPLMCNFGVRSRFLDVIYGVRPPNGSPAKYRGTYVQFFLRCGIHCFSSIFFQILSPPPTPLTRALLFVWTIEHWADSDSHCNCVGAGYQQSFSYIGTGLPGLNQY